MTELPAASFLMQREEWMSEGACRGADRNIFVLDQGITGAKAIEYCQRCTVTEECADYARRTKSIGVWGGRLFSFRHSEPVELIITQTVQDARPRPITPSRKPLILGGPIHARPLILGR